jgi:hypothetical protein
MLGYAPAAHEYETYLRLPSLMPHELAAVLAPAGAQGRAGWLLDWIEEAYGHPLRGRLPGPSVGASYTGGTRPRVTLHFYARALWGGDARIRRGFARAAGVLGWDPHAYLALTAPLASREDWRTWHGLVGITLDGASHVSLAIGVRPEAP